MGGKKESQSLRRGWGSKYLGMDPYFPSVGGGSIYVGFATLKGGPSTWDVTGPL